MQLKLPVLVFDIETVTDIQAGRQLYGLDLPEQATREALAKIRRQEAGTDFPKLPFHEIVCISGLWLDETQMQLFSWTQQQYSEAQILQKFVGIFHKYRPFLVSWNGGQFDLPVIMYRCMYHGIAAPELFEQGDFNRQQKFDNYQSRYQIRHTDLLDQLARFNLRYAQKLDEVAQFLGYAGKRGVSGYQVEGYVQQQNWQALSGYCEGDVLNTWLIYLRWLLLRGQLDIEQHRLWIQQTIGYLRTQPQQQDFLHCWQKNSLNTAFTRSDFPHE